MHRGYSFNSTADYELVREMKEKLCYVSVNIEKERQLAQETTCWDVEYKLPDGKTCMVGRERFEAPEILMRPDIIGMEEDGIADMVCSSIWGCDLDTQKALASNIWLSGGTSMIPGLSTRLENEVKENYVRVKGKGDRKILDRVKIYVHDPPRRKNAVFMGASFLASFAEDSRYISRQDYLDSGDKKADLFIKPY